MGLLVAINLFTWGAISGREMLANATSQSFSDKKICLGNLLVYLPG